MNEPHPPLFTSRRHRARAHRRTLPILGSVLVLVLTVAAGWWWTSSRGGDMTALSDQPRDEHADVPVRTASAGEEPMPALDVSDALVRAVVSGVSARPQFATWLVNDNLARRFVLAVVQVAHGRAPTYQLDFMAPSTRFRAKTTDGHQTIDPVSYHRYDALAATFASLDTDGTAEAFRRLRPLFENAYAELGLKDRTFDETLRDAFEVMLSVTVPEQPLEIEPQAAVYGFTSEKLERLSPAEKQLIRTGPANTRLIQAKLRELADALELSRAPTDDAGREPASGLRGLGA